MFDLIIPLRSLSILFYSWRTLARDGVSPISDGVLRRFFRAGHAQLERLGHGFGWVHLEKHFDGRGVPAFLAYAFSFVATELYGLTTQRSMIHGRLRLIPVDGLHDCNETLYAQLTLKS